MEVIPVIDLRGGAVVAARRGDRARYRPLETPLAASADPVTVALGLRSLYPFPTLYVADLDSIEGRGADTGARRRLAECWPGELWIDGGAIARGEGVPLYKGLSEEGFDVAAHGVSNSVQLQAGDGPRPGFDLAHRNTVQVGELA